MKGKNILKAGILLAILLLVLPISVESAQATLSIGPITGPIGVITTISSTTNETNVNWSIFLAGGWIFCHRTTNGIIPSIVPGTPAMIKAIPWGFGFFPISGTGPIIVTVTATSVGGGSAQSTGGPTHIFLILTW